MNNRNVLVTWESFLNYGYDKKEAKKLFSAIDRVAPTKIGQIERNVPVNRYGKSQTCLVFIKQVEINDLIGAADRMIKNARVNTNLTTWEKISEIAKDIKLKCDTTTKGETSENL